jgi:hypothetical protein
MRTTMPAFWPFAFISAMRSFIGSDCAITAPVPQAITIPTTAITNRRVMKTLQFPFGQRSDEQSLAHYYSVHR